MWADKLKVAGINIHIITTGGGAGLQQKLWEVPGSSAYLSGSTFPYDQDEQAELLGFMPEHFCSEEAAIDLASAAYMKAFKFGGKDPVGVGITASVASEKAHRGDHRVFACIITNDKVRTTHLVLEKGVGMQQRQSDGDACDDLGLSLLIDTFLPEERTRYFMVDDITIEDATEKARAQFMRRPLFTMDGKRHSSLPNEKGFALMPGAFNPPHEGHFGITESMRKGYAKRVVFEVTSDPPHKDALTVQDMLKRAKLLHGHDRFFSTSIPMYIDKARAYPGMSLLLGADAMVRMLDPKWGMDVYELFNEFDNLDTTLLVAGRMIGDKFVTRDDILQDLKPLYRLQDWSMMRDVMQSVDGRFDISSTELRNKTK